MSERTFETTEAFRELINAMRELEDTFLFGDRAVEQDVSVNLSKSLSLKPPNNMFSFSKDKSIKFLIISSPTL